MTIPRCTRCNSWRSPALAAVAPCEYCGASPRDTQDDEAPAEVYAGRQRVVMVVNSPRLTDALRAHGFERDRCGGSSHAYYVVDSMGEVHFKGTSSDIRAWLDARPARRED